MRQTSTLLLFFVLASVTLSQLTIISPTTQNQSTTDASVSYMTTLCASVPTSTLGLCNNTCLECTSSSSADCLSCSTGYYLRGKHCLIDNSISNYTYAQYAGNNLLVDDSTIGAFVFSKTNEPLGKNDIMSACQNTSTNSYEFVSAGLFKSTDTIQTSISLVDPIDQIQIKFNFKSVVASMKLFISLNDNIIYSKSFTQFSDLSGTYTVDPNNNTHRNFMSLPSMSASTVNSIWLQVDTSIINYIVSTFTLKFYVQSNSSATYTWGFHDMVILKRACQTCVSQQVQKLIEDIGAAIVFTIIIVIAMMIILSGAIIFEEWRRKKAFQEKLGSSSSNLPTKAMNRVLDAVKGTRKNREKQWTAEAKKFNKTYARLFSQRSKSSYVQ